jgi:hypothetical protein
MPKHKLACEKLLFHSILSFLSSLSSFQLLWKLRGGGQAEEKDFLCAAL